MSAPVEASARTSTPVSVSLSGELSAFKLQKPLQLRVARPSQAMREPVRPRHTPRRAPDRQEIHFTSNHDKVDATSLTTLRTVSLRPQRMHRVHDRRFPRRHIGRNARNDKN